MATTTCNAISLESALRLLREVVVFHRKHHDKWWYRLARYWGWRYKWEKFEPKYGICGCLIMMRGKYPLSPELQPLFERWPYYSGMVLYPVIPPSADELKKHYEAATHPDDILNARIEYHNEVKRALRSFEKDIWIGEYGRRRLSLLNFMIAVLEDERVHQS